MPKLGGIGVGGSDIIGRWAFYPFQLSSEKGLPSSQPNQLSSTCLGPVFHKKF